MGGISGFFKKMLGLLFVGMALQWLPKLFDSFGLGGLFGNKDTAAETRNTPVQPAAPQPNPAPSTLPPSGQLSQDFSTQASAPAVAPSRTAIMMIGDSLGVGLNEPLKELAQQDGVQFLDGKPEGGTMVSQWITEGSSNALTQKLNKRFEEDLEKLRNVDADHKIVFLSFGTNESYSNQSPLHKQNLNRMIDKLEKAGAEVLWVSPDKLPDSIPSSANKGTRAPRNDQVLAEFRDHFDDKHWVDARKFNLPTAPDKIHKTGEGYKLWANHLYSHMRDTLLPQQAIEAPKASAPQAAPQP